MLQAAIVYAQADRLEYVKMLIEAGSEVNHRDEANHNSMLNLLAKSKKVGRRSSCPAVNNTVASRTVTALISMSRFNCGI